MNRQEMMQHHDQPRRSKAKFGFGRTEAWRDRNGTHRRVEIWWGGEVVGMIEGEPFMNTPSMQYEVCDLNRKTLSTHDTMREAKAAARVRWTNS